MADFPHLCFTLVYKLILVGGLEHVFFFHILGKMIPADELIFFRGGGLNW